MTFETFDKPVTKAQIREGGVTFTVCTGRDEFYTFRVSRSDTTPPIWFVTLVIGPDDYDGHSFLGCLDFGWGGMYSPTVTAESNTPGDVFNRAMLLIWESADNVK